MFFPEGGLSGLWYFRPHIRPPTTPISTFFWKKCFLKNIFIFEKKNQKCFVFFDFF